jgi:hypothetical protein
LRAIIFFGQRMARQAESILSSKIADALNRRGHCVSKNHGNAYQRRGRSDIEGSALNAGHIAIETKLPGKENTVTEQQWLYLWRVRRSSAHARCGIATSVAQGIAIAEGKEIQTIPGPAEIRRRFGARKNPENIVDTVNVET